jgi:dTMP kinase
MLITFEGIEGCGKSTQAMRVRQWLHDLGQPALLSREPGGTAIGRSLRTLLLDAANNYLCARAELFLYLADRAQHVHEVLKPALEAGIVVVGDRFADSTVVYQGFGRGLDVDMVQGLNELAVDEVRPDLTFILDLPPEIGLQRANSRNQEQGTVQSEGRFEAESLAFHSRLREGYLSLAANEKDRFVIINGTQPADEIFAAVQQEILSRMKKQRT